MNRYRLSNFNTLKYLLICIGVTFLFTACSGGQKNEVTIQDWQILFSQESSHETVLQSTGWQKTTLPLMVRPPYPRAREIRFFWLRGSVEITIPEKYYGLAMGRVYFSDNTFLNKLPLGSHPPAEVHEMHRPRYYRIAPGRLKAGKNEILVRVGTYGTEYGGIHDQVRLMEKAPFIKSRIWHNILFVYLPLGVLLFFLGPLIFSLILIALKKDIATNLVMSAILIFWTAYLLAVYSPWFPGSYDARITILWGAVCFMSILFILFIQSYYKTFVSILNTVLIPILLSFVIIIIIFNDSTSPLYPGKILGVATFLLMLPAGSYLMYYLYKKKPGTTIFYFLFLGFGPIVLFIGYDIINYLFLNHVPPMIHVYFLPVTAVLYLLLRIKDLIRNEIRLEILYNDLSRKVETNDIQEKQLTITAEMEGKLDKVIDFLKENYRSAISREGLARAVDVSPDHMSRSFKQYTGKRILDFINELRIKETEGLLKNTDKKIVDIAFDVGFENLVSFNRVFYKINKMTPSKYRAAGTPKE